MPIIFLSLAFRLAHFHLKNLLGNGISDSSEAREKFSPSVHFLIVFLFFPPPPQFAALKKSGGEEEKKFASCIPKLFGNFE